MFLYIRHAVLDNDPAGNGGRELVVSMLSSGLTSWNASPIIPPGPVAHTSMTTFRSSMWKNHVSAIGGIMRPDWHVGNGIRARPARYPSAT
jgi:hypothetical protein